MTDYGLAVFAGMFFAAWAAIEIYRMRCLVRLAELAKQEEKNAGAPPPQPREAGE